MKLTFPALVQFPNHNGIAEIVSDESLNISSFYKFRGSVNTYSIVNIISERKAKGNWSAYKTHPNLYVVEMQLFDCPSNEKPVNIS